MSRVDKANAQARETRQRNEQARREHHERERAIETLIELKGGYYG